MKNTWVGMITAILLTLALSTSALADSVAIDHGSLRQNSLRYGGLVIDSDTGNLLPNVCVWAGPTACPEPALRTDDIGYWAIDLPDGPTLRWDMHFQAPGYAIASTVMNADTRFILVGLHRIP